MAEPIQDIENAAGNAEFSFDRLIGIGVRAHRDRPWLIVGRGELLFQKLGGVWLRKQLRFKIESRREPLVGVGRTREAVDAVVLTASVWIDRAVKRNVGRVVARNNRTGLLERDLGRERRRFVERAPAVVIG